jgi:hypothetical protein
LYAQTSKGPSADSSAGAGIHVREQLPDQLKQAIADSDPLADAERQKLHGGLSAKRGLKRFLRTTKTALLRIDRAAVQAEAHLDGKYGAARSFVPKTGFGRRRRLLGC